ncbi:MAG TPA: peptidoglycan-associated lipoprotein Pal, partial [Sedimenticola thiotaurini]|nr:peptidoglycan-associated lipoprotein Pal [Sedimenticola thiotaurini]
MKLNQLKLAGLLVLSLLFVAGCSSTPEKADTEGAPVSEAGGGTAGSGDGDGTAAASEGAAWSGSPLDDPNSLLSVRVIHFAFDSSEIQGQDRDVIIAHGEYLAANPEVTVTVEGHTDERGSREYNIALGERRANAVKELMLVQGAAESQITTVSYGEERPVALGSDEESWAL